MVSPGGQIVRLGESSSIAEPMPFYHFWIAERDDVFAPIATGASASRPYLLPMPAETHGYPNLGDATGRFLKGDRRLVTVTTRTGAIVTNRLDATSFDAVPNVIPGPTLGSTPPIWPRSSG